MPREPPSERDSGALPRTLAGGGATPGAPAPRSGPNGVSPGATPFKPDRLKWESRTIPQECPLAYFSMITLAHFSLDISNLLVPGGKWQTETVIPVSSAKCCNCSRQRRDRELLLPPPSAVISNSLASG